MTESGQRHVSTSSDRTVPHAVIAGARRWPDRRLLVDETSALTYSETLLRMLRLASAFNALGLVAGQRVLVMMDNHCDFALVWFALNYLGATMVTANTAYKGDSLRYVIENSESDTLIADARYLGRIVAAATEWRPRCTILRGGSADRNTARISAHRLEDLFDAEPAGFGSPARVSDPTAIIYTSGTTGRSKGVIVPHGSILSLSDPRYQPAAAEGDIVPCVYPIYYVGGLDVILNATQAGATVVIFPRFSASGFWKAAAECGATYSPLNGAMANFLNRQPAGPHDRAHRIRRMRVAPVFKDIEPFQERFGITEVSTVYGMTECSYPLVSPFGKPSPGSIGWARPDFEVKIFDAADNELPDGAVGQIVIRPKEPWSVMLGYHRMPEATAEMWRNLWLHTGDLGMRKADGEFYFIDREKDSLRRRGENVSSQEVESYIYRYESILECAVVAVSDEETGGDEIKAYLTLKAGCSFEFSPFIAFLADRMPSFWVPRFVEIVDEMPKSDNGRIRKQALKGMPPGPRAWDREREGIVLKR